MGVSLEEVVDVLMQRMRHAPPLWWAVGHTLAERFTVVELRRW